jgi:two-component system chemotaxis response regulator CheY
MQHHVLILDDEEDIRKTICRQLSGTQYEILEAADAEQAMELLDEYALTVDVIITDVRMPKISGVEAVEYFRANHPTTPIIVLTGFPDMNLAVEFMKDGVVDYLVKPVERDNLIAAVEKAAHQRTLFQSSSL